MAQKQPKTDVWGDVVGAISCLVVFLLPFFPDEKLIRPKMQFLELSIFLMVGLIGIRIFLTSRPPFQIKDKWRLNFLPATILIWVFIQTFLYFVSSERSLANNELRRILLAGASFSAFGFLDIDSKWVKRLLSLWGVSAGLLGVYGVLQVHGGFGVIQVPQMDRVMATYGNPIFFAVFLVTSIFVTWAACQLQTQPLIKNLLVGSLFFQGAALYFTQTRAAWIAFGVALLLGVVLKFRWTKIPPWIVALGLLGIGFFSYQTRSVWQRDQGHLLIWRDTVRMWADHPVKGVGLGAFHTRFPSYAQEDLKSKWPQGQTIINYAHNEYLQTLAETGVLGFVSFIAVLVAFFLMVRPSLGKDNVALALVLAVVALLVQNLFSVDMRFGISFSSLFILMGLLFAYHQKNEMKVSLALFPWPVAPRFSGAFLWIGFMALVVFPKLMEPYQAQKKVSEAIGFFNERLLDPAKSIHDLEALAERYPKEPQVLEKLAYVYAKEMKTADDQLNIARAEAALATYQKLLEVDPARTSAVNNMANINYTMGRRDEAIGLWKKCVEMEPAFMDALLNLGKTLYVKGELKESTSYFEKVLKLQPGHPEAIVYLKRMVE